MSARRRLIAKVQALLSKTVGNGCTEEEASAALAKARELMAEHDVGDTDLAFGGETVTREKRDVDDRMKIRQQIAIGVGAFCSCRVWRGFIDEIVFCGLQSDAIFAHWLLDMLADHAKRALETYLQETEARIATRFRRRETDGFVIGFCSRLTDRLESLAPKSTELTVKKNELIKVEMGRMRMRRRPGKSVAIDNAALRAGEAAGDAASFNKPVGQRVVLEIGRP